MEGKLLYKNVHDVSFTETRKGTVTVRGVAVRSAQMGVSGACDVVEFIKDDSGIPIQGRSGKYRPCPIEYKRGKPKQKDEDILQLTAQAMCLEEMLCCQIEAGCLFYGEIRRRLKVEFTDALKEKVSRMFDEMHRLCARGHTPKVKPTKACGNCSLNNLCLPVLCKDRTLSAYDYIERATANGGEGAI